MADQGFDVVVIAGSLGAESAVLSILKALPPDFAVPIVVMQHLSPDSEIATYYGARLKTRAVEWLEESLPLTPGTVHVCPPRSFVELLPNGACRLRPCSSAVERPMNRLFESVARSFAHRAIGVVLTGMGSDAAAGALELHRAGGRVIVQTEETARSPEMPRAAIAAGAADLVVRLSDVAQVIAEIVAGTPRPKARSELDAVARLFGLDGEIAAAARDKDWSLTPLGPVVGWGAELCTIVRTTIQSVHPTAIWWGRELLQLYNEPWRTLLGASRHPAALGGPARDTWSELWDEMAPMVGGALNAGAVSSVENRRVIIDRDGHPEEAYFTFTYSPIRDATGAVTGVHLTAVETTPRVLAERRLAALRALASEISGAATLRQACEQAASALGAYPSDVPFALLYLLDPDSRQATLAAATAAPGSTVAPHVVSLGDEQAVWPLERVLGDGPTLLPDLARHLPEGAREQARAAFLVPLRLATRDAPIGVLVAAVARYRPFDEAYRQFVQLVAQQISAGLTHAQAMQLERERAERLSELDGAKTEFFANVSHEFRTPLTLLLTPLDHLLSRRHELPDAVVGEIEMAARNSRRLLRLVDNLLEFSQIDRSREGAVLEPTDLCALTTDIASAFRSAIESAGLELRVECAPDLPLVPVVPEMWEKIVSNLLANALKFTFEGAITVAVRALTLHAELVVSDTGIGIPQGEQPNLFKRFHRVRGARARTVEGSGIGLAIVRDLVYRLGGQLRVQSREGAGTAFTIWLPFKTRRALAGGSAPASSGTFATGLADEAARWSLEGAERSDAADVADELLGEPALGADGPRGTLVVADDNADLRDYLRRLLGARWNVELAADGVAALDLTRRVRPDVVLADVMMPGLDGFSLLRKIREDADLRHTPVILLTARAGEQAAIDGLLAGADDYIAKPFSPRELVARIRGQIELARTRRRVDELNAFLVRFSDAVHGLTDAREVARIACQMTALHLDAEHSHWTEIDWSTREYVVETLFSVEEDRKALIGRFPINEIDPFTSTLLGGSPMIIHDPHADPRRFPAALIERMYQLGATARIQVPVMVEGTLRAILSVNQRLPRRWTADEIAFVGAVAGRCWAEVERARAEQLLRTSEENYRSLFESMDEGYALCELVRDAEGRPVAVDVLQNNPAFEPLAPVPRETVHLDAYVEAVRAGETKTVEAFDVSRERWVAIRVHPRGGDRFALLCLDITTRKRAEQTLARQAARDAFRVRLADALQGTSDAAELQYQACRALGEELGAARAAYWVLEPGDVIAIEREWVNGAPAIPRRLPLSSVDAESREQLRRGLPLVRDDVRADPRLTDDDRAVRGGLGVISGASVPLRKDGEVVAVLAVFFGTAHHWVDAELELMGEVAERTWAAMERARVEAALRESEAKLAVELADARELQRISSLLAKEDNPAALYPAILDAAAALMRSEFASIQMLVPERNELFLLAHKGFHADSARHWEWVRADDASTCGVALERGEAVIVRDIEEFERAAGTEDLESYRRSGIRAIQSTPLVARNGRVVGMISTHWREPHEPTQRELGLLDVVARQAADILERHTADRSLRESELRYRTLFESSVQPMGLAELVRDPGGRAVDYRWIATNPAMEQMSFSSRAALTGKLRSETHAADPDVFQVFVQVVESSRPMTVECYSPALERPVRFTTIPQGGDRFAALVTDLSEEVPPLPEAKWQGS